MTRLSENVIQKAYDDYGTGIVARGIIKSYHSWYEEQFEVSRIGELFEPGESKNDFFVRYALSHPGLGNALIGTRNIEHLKNNIAAAEKGALAPDVYEEAKRRLTFSGAVAGPVEMGLFV